MAGLLAALPGRRGQDRRRLRPAVPRRRLGRPLVLARLRRPHDRHQLGRRVRRRVPQGRRAARPARGLRRRGQERDRRFRVAARSAARASTPPSSSATRRTATGESVSWALEGFINDFGIGNMAASSPRTRPRRVARAPSYQEESKYFLERATHYVNLFNPKIGFFQGRDADGTFLAGFDPRDWGGDYTETNGWNFAFTRRTTARPGQPLRRPEGAARRSSTRSSPRPRRATHPGGYGGTIHEMLEARDVRMGQLGMSNQLSHHIPYMYDYAGRRPRPQGWSGRSCAGSTSAARSARATRATRTTARCRRGTSSARSASTRCRSARPTGPSARRSSPGHRPPQQRRPRRQRAEQQHEEHLRAGRQGQRHEAQERLDRQDELAGGDHGRLRDGRRSRRAGAPRTGRARRR